MAREKPEPIADFERTVTPTAQQMICQSRWNGRSYDVLIRTSDGQEVRCEVDDDTDLHLWAADVAQRAHRRASREPATAKTARDD
jgi:hypothetical protein